MWPFSDDSEEQAPDPQADEFQAVTNSLIDLAPDSDTGMQMMQDAYNQYDFTDSGKANQIFTDASDRVRKKFGDTKAYDYETAIANAPIDMADITPEATDPEAAKIETINKWEQQNLEKLDTTTDLPLLQAKSQLTRGISQAASMQRRQIYGTDNYLVTDIMLRAAEGAIDPLAEAVGADSVVNYFKEETDPDGQNVFGYKVGGDNSYLAAISGGAGGAAAAITAGVVAPGWGTAAYLGAAGTGSVVKQVRTSLQNEGTVEEAIGAGALEAVNQGIQIASGEAVFGGAAEKIAGKEVAQLGTRIYPRIAKDAALQAVTGGAGGIISNEASNIGEGKDDDVLQGLTKNIITGGIIGAGAGAVGEYLGKAAPEGAKDTQPSAEDTRGKGTQYHGARAPIDSLQDTYYSSDNIYGGENTLYTTDALDVAAGYGRKSPSAETYKVNEKEPVNLFNMEKPLAKDQLQELFPNSDIADDAIKNLPEGSNLREVMDEIRDTSSDYGYSKDTVQGIFATATDKLAEQGYGGMKHTGGLKSGKDPHTVKIYFDPKSQVSLENVKQPSIQSLQERSQDDLTNIIEDTNGTPPPKPEVVPGPKRTVTLDTPGESVMKLSDGSEIVESDGNHHLVKNGEVLENYQQTVYVTPEQAAKLKKLTNAYSSNPDGTAITLTTDKSGRLLVESDFLDPKLNVQGDKTGSKRVAVPTEDSPDGNVPVFINETTTKNGVRQNNFHIADGKVTDSSNAMKAGTGQKVSKFVQKLIDEHGPDQSEELGFAVTQYSDNPDGTMTSEQIPLITYFPQSNEESGNAGRDMLSQKGLYKTMEHLNNQESFNSTDKAAASIIRTTLNEAYQKAVKAGSIPDQIRYGDLYNTAVQIEAKGSGETGRTLQLDTKAAQEIITGKSSGDMNVSLLKTELIRQANEDYKKETGEDINLKDLTEKRDAAEKQMKANEPKPAKEGEAAEPVHPEVQRKYDEAKATYESTIDKINKSQEKLKERLKTLSPEDEKSLKDLYDVLKITTPGTGQRKVAQAIFDIESKLVTKDSSPNWFQKVFNFYRKNLLSGPSTQERNVWGNTTSALSNVLGLIGSGDFKAAGQYTNEWLKATPQSWNEAKEILKGTREGRFKFDERLTDKKGNLKNLKQVDSIDPRKRPFTFIQNMMYRALNAQDALFYRNANSAAAYLAESIANKHIKDPGLRREVIENNLGRSPEKLEEVVGKVYEQASTLKKAGIDISDKEINNMIYEMMEQSRPDATNIIANKHAEKSIFTQDPTGVSGLIYDIAEFTMGRVPILKLAMPFTRVASNIASHVMEFTPVGALKVWRNNPEGKPGLLNHAMTDIDAKMVMGRSVVGSMVMGGFMGLAYMYKDDEKPFIEFYGYPEGNEWKKWKDQGIDNFSMRVGGTIIPLQGTSLAIIPAVLGGAMKNIKRGAAVEDVMKAASVASLGAVSTMSFLKPAGDLFNYFVGEQDSVTDESGKTSIRHDNFGKSQLDSLISGFTPASGFFNNIGRWMNSSPTETYNNLTAKLMGDLPFARDMGVGKPQLNMFGQPIEKSLVERFSAGLAPHTIKTDPVFLWMQETGFGVTDQGPILRLSTKAEKATFSESQKENHGYADIMDEEQSRKVLEISGPQIKQFLISIKDTPGFQVMTESKQKYINSYVNSIRARAKQEVLGKK